MTNSFVFTGVIIKETDYRTGTSKSSGKVWIKRSYLFEEAGLAEHKQSFVGDTFDETTQQWLSNNVGKAVDVRFEVHAREYNGRMFQDVRIVDVLYGGRNVRTSPLDAERQGTQQRPLQEGESEELPF